MILVQLGDFARQKARGVGPHGSRVPRILARKNERKLHIVIGVVAIDVELIVRIFGRRPGQTRAHRKPAVQPGIFGILAVPFVDHDIGTPDTRRDHTVDDGVQHFGAGADEGLAHGIHLDTYHVAGRKEAAPGIHGLPRPGKLAHSAGNHGANRLVLEVALADAPGVSDGDHFAAIGARNAECGRCRGGGHRGRAGQRAGYGLQIFPAADRHRFEFITPAWLDKLRRAPERRERRGAPGVEAWNELARDELGWSGSRQSNSFWQGVKRSATLAAGRSISAARKYPDCRPHSHPPGTILQPRGSLWRLPYNLRRLSQCPRPLPSRNLRRAMSLSTPIAASSCSS